MPPSSSRNRERRRSSFYERRRRSSATDRTHHDSPAAPTWEQLCEITAGKILRNGFIIDYLKSGTSVLMGGELQTGVILVVTSGKKSVKNVRSETPGIGEGIRDMARDGLDGRMILYGLAFHFAPAPE
ncbi:hypothetical protein GGR57DRAFT_254191 [Xylariaceae sp. FL1272]|nr:hypothetical protein GGR57DRAFT_254191 [Xylariaceae sp. FL1272]